jgi:uracil-DNA glycosylase
MSLKRKAADGGPLNDSKKPKANGSITSFFSQPRTVSTTPKGPGSVTGVIPDSSPVASKFDKEAWVKKLTAEQKELLQLEITTLHESWLKELKDEIMSKEFLELKKFLKKEHEAGKKIFPPAQDVYSWFVPCTLSSIPSRFILLLSKSNLEIVVSRSRHTPLHTVKAVILGQDPYHNINQAHGLAFSVRPPTPAPPSLKNIYIALKNDYPTFSPPPNKGGLLTPWADRGVLLLNTCLTVRAHEANSHSNRGWEKFTQKVIDVVAAKRTKGVVFLAWGSPAGKRVGKVDRKRHLVLQSVHPSPLSASRGWFDCGHFKKSNEWLVGRYGEGSEIDWDLDVKPVDASI